MAKRIEFNRHVLRDGEAYLVNDICLGNLYNVLIKRCHPDTVEYVTASGNINIIAVEEYYGVEGANMIKFVKNLTTGEAITADDVILKHVNFDEIFSKDVEYCIIDPRYGELYRHAKYKGVSEYYDAQFIVPQDNGTNKEIRVFKRNIISNAINIFKESDDIILKYNKSEEKD